MYVHKWVFSFEARLENKLCSPESKLDDESYVLRLDSLTWISMWIVNTYPITIVKYTQVDFRVEYIDIIRGVQFLVYVWVHKGDLKESACELVQCIIILMSACNGFSKFTTSGYQSFISQLCKEPDCYKICLSVPGNDSSHCDHWPDVNNTIYCHVTLGSLACLSSSI